MPTNAKKHFLDCRSLAEMAVTLVAVEVILILPMAFLSVLLGFILNLPKYMAFVIPPALWLWVLVALWHRFVKIGRSWSEPQLAIKEFSYFQWTSVGFVLILSLAFSSAETMPAINMIRWFLSALFVMVNLAYVSLAVAIRADIPSRIYYGLIVNVLVAILPIWMK
jgi:hypothetical protein